MEQNIGHLQKKIKRGQNFLLLVIVFSVINPFLLLSNTSIIYLLSIIVPQLNLGIDVDITKGSDTFYISAIVLAILFFMFYLVFYFIARKSIAGIWAATVFFCINTFLLLIFILSSELDVGIILEIAFYALILYYLIAALSAHSKLKKMEASQPAPVPTDHAPVIDAEIISEEPSSETKDTEAQEHSAE